MPCGYDMAAAISHIMMQPDQFVILALIHLLV
jgi:hypothetical protein